MKILDISFSYDEQLQAPEALLQQHYTTVGWAESLCKQNVEITVIKRFSHDDSFVLNGVQYYFINDGLPGNLKAQQIPWSFLKRVAKFEADLVHLHTFPCSVPAFLLRFFLEKKTAMVIQNHGGIIVKGLGFTLYRQMSNVADAFFFTATEQGTHWFNEKKQLAKVKQVMEGGTFFNYATRDIEMQRQYVDRNIARQKTGMHGNLVLLWVGRLDENKDPLTVVDGFKIFCNKNNNARLYMIYSEQKLLNEVQEKIKEKGLEERVFLLGEIPHGQMLDYYNSADYFVLGSHYEGSGYALSEAMRCGCVPVITGIPSFAMMTDNGRLGALWQTGNKESFAQALETALAKPLQQEAVTCIDFFYKELSFDAIAKIAAKHYRDIIDARLKKSTRGN